jgi:hypothetical protein
MHDDNTGIVNSMWAIYYAAYIQDRKLPSNAYEDLHYRNAGTSFDNYRYGLDNDKRGDFFKSISIYTMSRSRFNGYTLVNPRIQSWNHGNVDYADGGTMESAMTIQYESEKDEEGHYPYNFLSVLMVARLYHTGTIDQKAVEEALDKLGVDSAFFSIYRAIIHIYSYYMPLAIQDKQWLSTKLGIPLRAFEMQSLRASKNKEISKRDLLSITVTKPEVVEEDG